ncbi:hypothetical protein [Kitasatospora azatica]|uniref:hypothetical protein n=1 Tax=Kitasatospora azatica TaxID=58347 RepID=UPI00056D93F0|nr:hypothetical protein [Kitasatospora azatica]
MSSRLVRTAAVALGAVALAGCAGAGGLHDLGPTRTITARPSPSPLWPAAEAVKSPSPAATPTPSPSPLPELTVPGDDLRAVDTNRVLGLDPGLRPDERSALLGCTGCQVLEPKYRDLTGDGRPELIVAVLTEDQRAYLHVYQSREQRVLPVLSLPVLPGFTAETSGQDLLVEEPTSSATKTTSTYHWNGAKQAFDRDIVATCPSTDAEACLPPGAATSSLRPDKKPSAVPSAAYPFPGPWVLPTPTPRPVPKPSSPGGSR